MKEEKDAENQLREVLLKTGDVVRSVRSNGSSHNAALRWHD